MSEITVSSVLLVDSSEAETNEPNSLQLTPGSLFLGKYELLEPLGRGGVGTVYKVRHLQLDKCYALKVLQTPNASSEAILRFRNEAKVISSLVHHNIVGVVDFGVTRDGRPYMVMDLVEGLPLSEFTRNNKLPVERLASIFRQVCDALAYAHESKIIHRDIKPENIIVSNQHGVDHVTVVDFGIAKNLEPCDARHTPNLTKTGDVFGTPAYMSPEQCLGQECDGRTDLYSLGCVMYEAYAGHAPFTGNSIFEVISKQINETPKRLPRRTVNGNGKDSLFEIIMLRAMAKQPHDRYKFAIEMAADLKRVESSESSVTLGLVSALRSVHSRAKAGSRITAFWNASALIAICFALILSFLLFSSPARMSYLCKEMQRESAILVLLCNINDKNHFGNDLNTTYKIFVRESHRMEFLTRGDKEEEALRLAMLNSSKRSNKVTAIVVRSMAQAMDNYDFDIFSRDGVARLGELAQSWADTSLKFSQMHSVVDVRCQKLMKNLERELNGYTIIKWLGAADLIVLAALIFIRFRSRLEIKFQSRIAAAEMLTAKPTSDGASE